MKVLVTGGTGDLGGRVVDLLLGGGHEVRVLSRKDRQADGGGPEFVRGDIRKGIGIEEAVSGCDAVDARRDEPLRPYQGSRRRRDGAARSRP